MKELYNEYFHIPKHGKIRDKVMLIRTAITAIIMIVCLAAMSITAYAYFSYNVSSGSNIIKAANFEAQITINDGTNEVPLTTDGEYRVASLEKDKTYTVTLTPPTDEGSAKTGFCVISIGENTYHTAQIGKDTAKNLTDASVTFTLKVSEETVIKILSHWGTSSFYGYENLDSNPLYIKAEGSEIDLTTVTSGVDESTTNEEQGATSETTATETTPTEVIYTIQSGDTLSKIAEQYNTTVARIVAYNALSDPNNIYEGQKLVIPPADYVVPADTTEQATTTPETTTTTETTTTPETTTPAETTTPPETTVTDPAETTAPAETTTSTETTGTPETSAPAETTEPAETTSSDTNEQTQPTTENSETTGAPTTEASE